MEKQYQPEPQVNTINRCPVCQSEHIEPVIQFNNVPVLCNLIWDSRQEALNAQRGDISLMLCSTCGHVYNEKFDPAKLAYDAQYENSLHYSPRFQDYARRLARYLVDTYGLHGKSIIEIGSGKGDFLRLLCEYGGSTGTGFDPSYVAADGDAHEAITFVKDLYSERYAGHTADLILSRHVLEHIPQPLEFIHALRSTIGQRKDTVVFFEVPNLSYILRDTAIWDVIYEHFSYFSNHSLAYLFSRAGFKVLKTSEAFGDQFLSIEALPGDVDQAVPYHEATNPVEALVSQVNLFKQRSQEKLAAWQEKLEHLRAGGRQAVVWGAGSKGISFLNMLPVKDEIAYIIDINPRKRGKYVTGAGQQILPPEALREIRPDTVIIMNPIYRDEIQNTLDQLEIEAEILTAS